MPMTLIVYKYTHTRLHAFLCLWLLPTRMLQIKPIFHLLTVTEKIKTFFYEPAGSCAGCQPNEAAEENEESHRLSLSKKEWCNRLALILLE